MRTAMSPERSLEIAERLTTTPEFQDFPDFSEKYLRILNRPEASGHGRTDELVPFVMNPPQADLDCRMEEKRKAGKPGRFIILKARRMGFSTFVGTKYFHKCVTKRNRVAAVAAQNFEATKNIVAMTKRMHNAMPSKGAEKKRRRNTRKKQAQYEQDVSALSQEEAAAALRPTSTRSVDLEVDLRPEIRRSNDNELWLTHPTEETMGLNSRYQVVVGNSTDALRSYEVHYLHCSEIAFWDDAESFMLASLQTISDDPDTCVVLESTANGAGGYFYKMFWRHWKGDGGPDNIEKPLESDWESVFYAWHFMPLYRRELPESLTVEQFVERMPDELAGMIEEYDLDMQQAWWAYRTWQDKCNSDWDQFRQEYPGKPEDAFATAAGRVFNETNLRACEEAVTFPVFRGDIVDGYEEERGDRARVASELQPRLERSDARGEPLWIWEQPDDKEQYIVFMDVATGGDTGDDTAIQVLRFSDGVQVAEWVGRITPQESTDKMLLLALYYNEAMIAWEVEGWGHYVSGKVQDSGYWNVYFRDHVESLSWDQRIGWSTNRATKPIMIATGVDIVNRQLPVIMSQRLLAQMRLFMEFSKKATATGGIVQGDEQFRRIRIGAPPGEHDDIVMAWLGAQAVRDREYQKEAPEERPPPRGSYWDRWEEDPTEDDRFTYSEPALGEDWI